MRPLATHDFALRVLLGLLGCLLFGEAGLGLGANDLELGLFGLVVVGLLLDFEEAEVDDLDYLGVGGLLDDLIVRAVLFDFFASGRRFLDILFILLLLILFVLLVLLFLVGLVFTLAGALLFLLSSQ